MTDAKLAIDENVIRVNGHDYWLYGAVDPATNEFLHVSSNVTTASPRS